MKALHQILGVLAVLALVALLTALNCESKLLPRPSTSLAEVGERDDISFAVLRADKISSNSSTAARSLATRASVCLTLRELCDTRKTLMPMNFITVS